MSINMAFADPLSAMQNYYNNINVITNAPDIVNGQSAGIISGGGFAVRSQSVTFQPFSFSPPSFDASCGNINFYSGAFSYINNTDQLIQFLQNSVMSAAVPIMISALKAAAPNIAGTIMSFFDAAQKMLNMASNSCQLGTGLGNYVGKEIQLAAYSSSTQGGDAGTALTGTTTSGNSQYKASSLLSKVTGDMNDWYTRFNGAINGNFGSNSADADLYRKLLKQNGSLMWKGIQSLSNVSSTAYGGDPSQWTDIANFIISVTGDVTLYTDASGDMRAFPNKSLIDVRALYTSSGDSGSIDLYSCSKFNAENPVECAGVNGDYNYPKVNISLTDNRLVLNQIQATIDNIQNVFVSNKPLVDMDKQIIARSPVPIFAMAQAMADAGLAPLISSQLQPYKKYIAFAIISKLFYDLLNISNTALAAIAQDNTEPKAQNAVTSLRDRIRSQLAVLNADASGSIGNVDPQKMLYQINYFRSYAMSVYSPSLVQKVQFAKQFGN